MKKLHESTKKEMYYTFLQDVGALNKFSYQIEITVLFLLFLYKPTYFHKIYKNIMLRIMLNAVLLYCYIMSANDDKPSRIIVKNDRQQRILRTLTTISSVPRFRS